jgi:hypothetical protein
VTAPDPQHDALLRDAADVMLNEEDPFFDAVAALLKEYANTEPVSPLFVNVAREYLDSATEDRP